MTIAQQLKIKDFPFIIKDKNGKEIYYENSNGDWIKREYNANGKEIYWEDSDGCSHQLMAALTTNDQNRLSKYL